MFHTSCHVSLTLGNGGAGGVRENSFFMDGKQQFTSVNHKTVVKSVVMMFIGESMFIFYDGHAIKWDFAQIVKNVVYRSRKLIVAVSC